MTAVVVPLPAAAKRCPVFPPGHPLVVHHLRMGCGVGVDYSLPPYRGAGAVGEEQVLAVLCGGPRTPARKLRVTGPKE